MKTSKAEVPTIFYPEDHKLLAQELDKILRKQRVKKNVSKIDAFLAQAMSTDVPAASASTPRRKR